MKSKFFNYNLDLIIKKFSYNVSKTGGRNVTGRIMVFNRGGGRFLNYILVNFKLNFNTLGLVLKLKNNFLYTSKIALIGLLNGKVTFILSSQNLQLGDILFFGNILFFFFIYIYFFFFFLL
jgi:large subunit ribosomal protein L2